jgi:hypothetical protein
MSKTFKLSINLDNDDFQEWPAKAVSMILERVAARVLEVDSDRIRDSNGNTVGEWSIDDDPRTIVPGHAYGFMYRPREVAIGPGELQMTAETLWDATALFAEVNDERDFYVAEITWDAGRAVIGKKAAWWNGNSVSTADGSVSVVVSRPAGETLLPEVDEPLLPEVEHEEPENPSHSARLPD